MLKLVAFDGDGVAFNSMGSYAEKFSQVLFEKDNIPREESVTYYMKSAGIDISDQFKYMLSTKGKDDENIVKDRVTYFLELLENEVPLLFDDFVPALKSIQDYPMVMASGTRQEVLDKRIEKYNLKDYIGAWVGRSENYNKKKYLSDLSKRPNFKLIFVGDGLKDMELVGELNGQLEMPRVVGIGVIRGDIFTEEEMKNAGASYVIRDLRKLKPIVVSI